MECEIVDSMAMGKAFKYCRTHKCESHACVKTSATEPMEKRNLPDWSKTYTSSRIEVGDTLVILVDCLGLKKGDHLIVKSIAIKTVKVMDGLSRFWYLEIDKLNKDYAVIK